LVESKYSPPLATDEIPMPASSSSFLNTSGGCVRSASGSPRARRRETGRRCHVEAGLGLRLQAGTCGVNRPAEIGRKGDAFAAARRRGRTDELAASQHEPPAARTLDPGTLSTAYWRVQSAGPAHMSMQRVLLLTRRHWRPQGGRSVHRQAIFGSRPVAL
jgi:hypothetical protein